MLGGYNIAVAVKSVVPFVVLLIIIVLGLMVMKSWVFYYEWKNKPTPVIEPEEAKVGEATLGVKDLNLAESREFMAGEHSAANILEQSGDSDEKVEEAVVKHPNVFDQPNEDLRDHQAPQSQANP